MTSDVEVQDLASPVLDREQTIQQFERDGWYGEKVERDDCLAMVLKEGQPTLPAISAAVHTTEIASYSSFGDLKAEFQKLTVDLGRSPTGIVLRQAADQVAEFLGHLWSARARARSPPPVPAKASPVPRDHCVGLDNEEHVLPAGPEAAQRDPEQPVERIQNRSWPFPFEDGDLLSKRQYLKRSGSATAKKHADGSEECEEKIEHESWF